MKWATQSQVNGSRLACLCLIWPTYCSPKQALPLNLDPETQHLEIQGFTLVKISQCSKQHFWSIFLYSSGFIKESKPVHCYKCRSSSEPMIDVIAVTFFLTLLLGFYAYEQKSWHSLKIKFFPQHAHLKSWW